MSTNVKARPGRRRVERGIYEIPNGKYMVCFMVAGKPRFRVVGLDLKEARGQREALMQAAKRGEVPVATSLRLSTVVDRWLVRYETRVAADLRRSRTLEAHRYYLDRHLLPRLGRRRVSAITVDDTCDVIDSMRVAGCSERPTGNALAMLHSALRFAKRHGWIVDDPIAKLEADERPHPQPRRQRVLGREEVVRLLACTADQYRPLVATALFTGMRISELLGLLWENVDFGAATIHVRAHCGVQACRLGAARERHASTPGLQGLPRRRPIWSHCGAVRPWAAAHPLLDPDKGKGRMGAGSGAGRAGAL
ncbi:MAG TPA: tyrosine-type recombinase/integrase [Baekduia sp.]|uniref:tyrosine-type recombinase/integrase n=1 Tax=Baekduia sp. TaxID=2600305 RepID=UPI002C340248|nr:tyrosine-type recombinase/integrase [Baekduia sp.]HMJ33161.1 tyrosine-type recombinase/integrase [Baekduia sp.]